VQTCTLRDLVVEGATAAEEDDPEAARLKSSADLVQAIEAAVRFYEEPPTEGVAVSTPWSDLWLSAADWAEAFESPEPGTPHNEARDEVLDELVALLVEKDESGARPDELAASLRRNGDLRTALGGAWPLLEATDLVGDLWSVPAYLRRCAPWLAPEEVTRLQRREPQAWTVSDLPLLDAARHRLGDPGSSRRRRQQDAALATERAEMDRVVEHLLESDDSEMQVMSMLRGADLQSALVHERTLPRTDRDLLAGPFAHVVVDEAQELTDAEWQMLLQRCPSRSFTVVGDRAQARHGFVESWPERLERVGFDHIEQAHLTVNYRTPREVMAEAEPVIRAVLPDANVPVSIRSNDVPVRHGSTSELDRVLDAWLGRHPQGTACVVGTAAAIGGGGGGAEREFDDRPRVRRLTPSLVKGLEFDLVVLVDPDELGDGIEGAVDRYVAMTRATQQLVVLTSP
jgi:hypothetical protein